MKICFIVGVLAECNDISVDIWSNFTFLYEMEGEKLCVIQVISVSRTTCDIFCLRFHKKWEIVEGGCWKV